MWVGFTVLVPYSWLPSLRGINLLPSCSSRYPLFIKLTSLHALIVVIFSWWRLSWLSGSLFVCLYLPVCLCLCVCTSMHPRACVSICVSVWCIHVCAHVRAGMCMWWAKKRECGALLSHFLPFSFQASSISDAGCQHPSEILLSLSSFCIAEIPGPDTVLSVPYKRKISTANIGLILLLLRCMLSIFV